MRFLKLIILFFSFYISFSIALPDPNKIYSEEEAWKIGWPMLTGPCGNFLPLRTGIKIVDDLTKANILWKTDKKYFGTAKTGSGSFKSASDFTARLGPNAKDIPGNWANVIIGDSKIFYSTFWPVGPFYRVKVEDGEAEIRLDADDVLIALDAKTGKELWIAREPGGLVLMGGKRGGFQVAPVYYKGKVFSMGSTGRVFAYDASTGKKLWETNIGKAYEECVKEREEVLKALKEGKLISTEGRGWHTSLVVAEDILIVPTFIGSHPDTGLMGIDIETGKKKWEIQNAISKYATPNVWQYKDREYILCATVSGILHLIDPKDGKELWRIEGLGPNYFTLSPSSKHVLVNIKSESKEKRVAGLLGAFRITPEKAEFVWKMPEEETSRISTWFDNCAHNRYLIRDGMVYVTPVGGEKSCFYLLDENTGNILAKYENKGGIDGIGGLTYLIEDRLFCRWDPVHGNWRGGRHPFIQWFISPEKIYRIGDENGKASMLDLVFGFETGYEVFMEVPIIAGYMFERAGGYLVCYDLREKEGTETYLLNLEGGFIGLPNEPLPIKLWAKDNKIYSGKILPPDSQKTGLPYGEAERFTTWQKIQPLKINIDKNSIKGIFDANLGNYSCFINLDLKITEKEIEGIWTREIEPLEKEIITEGEVRGKGQLKERMFPRGPATDDINSNSWEKFGLLPQGVSSWVIELCDCINLGRRPARILIFIDYDGKNILRSVATAFGYNQSWHEVDTKELKINSNKIVGNMVIILHPDWFVKPNEKGGSTLSNLLIGKRGIEVDWPLKELPKGDGSIAIKVEVNIECINGELKGNYKAHFGVPYKIDGIVKGKKIV